MKIRFAAPAMASAFALLSACSGGGGGGGVGTTPPPSPAPSASPTATPTPTAPTPTPTPTPPPPPQTNASLINLAVSETFRTNAATAIGSYGLTASCTQCRASESTLSVRYDAASGGYTVTHTDPATQQSRSQSFAPSSRDAAQSSASLDVYARTTGTTQESLALTRPGTSGPLTYRYVGGGVWQRVTTSGERADFSFDAFAYGVETAAADTPRTGAATFDVALIGALGSKSRLNPIALSGAGVLTTDFAGGTVTVTGTIIGTDTDILQTAFSNRFDGSGRIGSGTNGFTGSFEFVGASRVSGSMSGRFFGPAAEEVGASFSANDSFGDAAVGTIIGRRGSIAGATPLADLSGATSFDAPGAFLTYDRDPATKQLIASPLGTGGSLGRDMSYNGLESVRYTPATKAFALTVREPTLLRGRGLDLSGLSFDQSNIVAAKSDARRTVYEKTINGRTLQLTSYTPGPANPELALTYASFVKLEMVYPVAAGRDRAFEAYFPYGVETPASQMPRLGTASYAGRLVGVAGSQHDFTPNWSGPRPVDLFDLTGTAAFTADFGMRSLTATLNPVGTNRTTGATRDFGSLTASYGILSDSNRLGSPDYIAGAFFGPAANEVAVHFQLVSQPGSDGYVLTGVAFGKRN